MRRVGQAVARSPARTTRGSTTSTARCAPRRATTRPTGFDITRVHSSSVCRSRSGRAGCSSTCPATPARSTITSARFARSRRAATSPGGSSSARRTTTSSQANWKLAIENYHECYHCPAIHPELCRVSPPTSGENYDAAPVSCVGGSMELDRRRGDDVARRREPAAAVSRRSPRSSTREVLYVGRVPEHADQPAPGLRDDAPHRAGRARASARSSASGCSTRTRSRQPGLRPVVRGRLLGPHEPPGLGRVRERPAGDRVRGASSPGPFSLEESGVQELGIADRPGLPRGWSATVTTVLCSAQDLARGRRARRSRGGGLPRPHGRSRATLLRRGARARWSVGSSSNWQSAPPQAVWVTHGKGSQVFDVDGTEYVDLHAGFGVMLVGHAHPVDRARGLGAGHAGHALRAAGAATRSSSREELRAGSACRCGASATPAPRRR